MSKLKNPPLIEVIFEIKWNSANKQEIDKFQLLIGSIYAELKDQYGKPMSLLPDPNIPIQAFLGKPIYRFQNLTNNIPISYQLGPGILSINYVGTEYDWLIFSKEICKIVEIFERLYSFKDGEDVYLGLKYLDFFDFNFEQKNVFEYLKNKFHITIEAKFIENAFGLNFAIAQKKDDALFNILINTGILNNKRSGFIVESRLSITKPSEICFENFEQRINSFHNDLSSFFKSMTAGELYNSFK